MHRCTVNVLAERGPPYYELEMCEHFDENCAEVCVKTSSEQGLLFHFLLKKFPPANFVIFRLFYSSLTIAPSTRLCRPPAPPSCYT
jgi:hypothetical protein